MIRSHQVKYTSIFFIILIPVICLGVFFGTFYINYAHYSIENSYFGTFEKAVNQIENMFQIQETLSQYVGDNYTTICQEERGRYYPISESAVSAEISHLENIMKQGSTALIYFRGDRFIYTKDGRETFPSFEERYSNNINFAMSAFYMQLNQSKVPKVFQMELYEDAPGNNKITYIYPVPFYSQTPIMDIIFLMDEEYIKSNLVNSFGTIPMDFYIFSATYDMLYQDNMRMPELQKEDIFRIRGTGLVPSKNAGEDKVYLRLVSEDTERVYVMVMKKSDFYASSYQNTFTILYLVGITIAICIFLIVFTSRRRYKPLKKLIAKLTNNSTFPDYTDEYELIGDLYENSLQQTKMMQIQIREQNKIVIDHFILKLISNNRLTAMEIQNFSRITNIDAGKMNKVAVRIVFSTMEAQQYYLDQFSNGATAGENKTYIIYMAELLTEPGCVGMVFLPESEGNGNQEDIRPAIRGLYEDISRIIGSANYIHLGVGSACREMAALKSSYYEACASIQMNDFYKMTEKKEPIFYTDMNQPENQTDYYIPKVEIGLLSEGIHHGDGDVTISAANVITERLTTIPNSVMTLHIICSDIVRALVQESQKMNKPISSEEISQLTLFNSITDFTHHFTRITNNLCEYRRNQLIENEDLDMSSIVEYINKKYKDQDLSLDLACDELNMTRGKLNQLLNMYVGTSFWQYISVLRFNEVKRQLAETDIPINEIVHNVGYQDVSNFLRKFKKTEGMTAKEYRSQAQVSVE